MSDWRSPIPNKLPIVPKKEGAPAGEKAGDGRENGEGKVQGAVKVRKGKNTVPQTGPYSGGFFQLTGVLRRIFVPANGPVFRGIPLRRHLPSDERGSPVFCGKRPRASFGKCVRAGRGNIWQGKGALSRIFGIRAVSVSAAGWACSPPDATGFIFPFANGSLAPQGKTGRIQEIRKIPGLPRLGTWKRAAASGADGNCTYFRTGLFSARKNPQRAEPGNRRRGQPGTGKRKSAAPGTDGQTLRYFKYRSYQVSTKSGAKGPFFWRIQ